MLITTVVAYVTASTSLIDLATNPIILLIAVLPNLAWCW